MFVVVEMVEEMERHVCKMIIVLSFGPTGCIEKKLAALFSLYLGSS